MAPTDDTRFGVLLKRHRLAAGLTQESLAERARMSPKAVSDLERNPARTPRLGTVGLLADALDLAPEPRAALLAAARPGGTAGVTADGMEPPGAMLPRPLTPLVGRAGVVATAVELLSRGDLQLLTLTGPGGVGKTRVAIEVARQAADRFRDGTVFVDLAPLRDPGLVLGTIARCTGVDERDATPLHDRVVASLQSRQMLLLLDNFEQVVAAGEAVLSVLESCPGVVALVTSRVALHLRGGRDYPITPLALPEPEDPPETLAQSPAVELFVDRARAAGAEPGMEGEDRRAVVEICRRLEGLPLGIELAAARAKLFAPPALLARLDKRLPLLAGGPRDLPARQKTMANAIAWSYELLEESEQALFRQVCVFAGGFRLEAAEAVCGQDADTPPVVDGLGTLVDNSLLRLAEAPTGERPDGIGGGPRLVMLETIREYGIDQLETLGESSPVRLRHATHYLELAEEAERALGGTAAPAWLAQLDVEHDNMRAALWWACQQRDAVTALRLSGALWRFWDQRGHLAEGRRWLREALGLYADTGEVAPSLHVRALVGAATLAIAQAAYDEAETDVTRAVTLAREHGSPPDLVAALNARGLLARQQNRYGDSVRDHQEALSLARGTEDRAGEVAALSGLAFAAMVTGDTPGASSLAAESVGVARLLGDRHLLARALFLAAWGAVNGGTYEEAEAVASEALGHLATLGHTGEYGEALFLMGNVALFRGDYERAASLFGESLALNRTRGDERVLPRDLGGLASAMLNTGDLPVARSLLEESLTETRRHGDDWSTAMSLTLLGHVELAEGDDGRANELLAEAADLFQTIGNLLYLPWCLEGLIGVASAQGRYQRAAELAGACESVRHRTGTSVPPIHPAAHDRAMACVREALPEESFTMAWATGEGGAFEQILAAALADFTR